MGTMTSTRAGGRSRAPRPEPPPESETPPGGDRSGGSKGRRNQTQSRLPQPRRGGKTRPPARADEAVYDRLTYLGTVRDLGSVFEALGPCRERWGRFPTYGEACRAICRRSIEQRGGS